MIKISVIIPTWKRAYELNEVCKGLCLQTFKTSEFEVIICDSNSNDGTKKIVESYKQKINIILIHSKVNAQSIKRNDGAKLAKGEILIFLDDDVIPSTSLLETYFKIHQSSKNKVLLGLSLFSKKKEKQSNFIKYRNYRSKRVLSLSENVPSNNFVSMNFSIKKSDFFKIGLFDEEFINYGGEDHDFPCRMEKLDFKSIMIPKAKSEHIEPNPILINRMKKIYISARYGFVPLKNKFPDFFKNRTLGILELFENDKKTSIKKFFISLVLSQVLIKRLIAFLHWSDNKNYLYISIFYRLVFAAAYYEGVKDRNILDQDHKPYFTEL